MTGMIIEKIGRTWRAGTAHILPDDNPFARLDLVASQLGSLRRLDAANPPPLRALARHAAADRPHRPAGWRVMAARVTVVGGGIAGLVAQLDVLLEKKALLPGPASWAQLE